MRLSSLHVGLMLDKTRVWAGFSGGFSCFPHPQIYSTNSPPRLIHFVSFVPVMMHQAWLASILAFHRPSVKELHHISSLNPALCLTLVEDMSGNLATIYHPSMVSGHSYSTWPSFNKNNRSEKLRNIQLNNRQTPINLYVYVSIDFVGVLLNQETGCQESIVISHLKLIYWFKVFYKIRSYIK